MTILLSSHLLSQVQSVCDRVGIFARGKLIGVGTVPELAARFGEPFVRIELVLDGLTGAAEVERARGILAGVPGVDDVAAPEQPRDPWTLQAMPDTATAVRVAVLAASAREGLPLSSIRELVPSLDDIYRRALRDRGLSGGRVAA